MRCVILGDVTDAWLRGEVDVIRRKGFEDVQKGDVIEIRRRLGGPCVGKAMVLEVSRERLSNLYKDLEWGRREVERMGFGGMIVIGTPWGWANWYARRNKLGHRGKVTRMVVKRI